MNAACVVPGLTTAAAAVSGRQVNNTRQQKEAPMFSRY